MGLSTARLLRSGLCRMVLALGVVVAILLLGFHSAHFVGLHKEMQLSIGKHLAAQFVDQKSQSQSEISAPDDHPDLIFMRKFGRISGLPTEEEAKNMSRKQLTYIYHSYLDNTDYACRRQIRLGTSADGGWEVCDDYEFRPMKPCIVYSFGINNDFSFDDDAAKLYGCNVFSFDPTMSKEDHMRSAKVRFLKLGLGGHSGIPMNPLTAKVLSRKNNIKTLTDIKQMLSHTNTTIDILKMDIEYSEWSALPDMLEKNELTHVRQFLIEFHVNMGESDVFFRAAVVLFGKLEALGFRKFQSHVNPWGHKLLTEYPVMRSSAYELNFVNTAFARDSLS